MDVEALEPFNEDVEYYKMSEQGSDDAFAGGEPDGPIGQETMDDAEESEAAKQVDPAEVLHTAELDYIEAALFVQSIEEEIDNLKKSLKDARESRDECGVRLRDLRDGNYIEPRKPPSQDDRQFSKQQEADLFASPPSPTDAEWRATPLSKLWSAENPIKGMGKKKQDAIIELCPTFGAFEDLRAEAVKTFKPLDSLLPDGVGKALADELCERLFAYAPPVAPEARQPMPIEAEAEAEVTEELTVVSTIDKPADGSPVVVIEETKKQPESPEKKPETTTTDDSGRVYDENGNNPNWPKRRQRKKVADAPKDDDPQATADAEPKKPKEQKSTKAKSAKAGTAVASAPSDNPHVKRAEEIKAGSDGNFNYYKNKTAWQSGMDARRRGWLITDCAWVVPSDNADDWIRGWLFADASMPGEPDNHMQKMPVIAPLGATPVSGNPEADAEIQKELAELAAESDGDDGDESAGETGEEDEHQAEADIYSFPTG